MNYNVDDFSNGEEVAYIPTHANGNLAHSDVENGYVNSKNDTFVFVRYIRHGILQQTSQATSPKDLEKGHY